MDRKSSALGFAIIFISILVNKFTNSVDVCLLPPKSGFCRGMFPRWYYNRKTGKCGKFYWGGCPMGSNDNRFDTQAKCSKKCQALSCSKQFQSIGCFTNYLSIVAQPWGQELLNERDLRSKAFNGTLIDWLRWQEYLPSMLCRCAERADNSGYKVFLIHNFGECWGTNEHQENMLNKTSQCWDRFYGQQCGSHDVCVGGPSAYYFYKLT